MALATSNVKATIHTYFIYVNNNDSHLQLIKKHSMILTTAS